MAKGDDCWSRHHLAIANEQLDRLQEKIETLKKDLSAVQPCDSALNRNDHPASGGGAQNIFGCA